MVTVILSWRELITFVSSQSWRVSLIRYNNIMPAEPMWIASSYIIWGLASYQFVPMNKGVITKNAVLWEVALGYSMKYSSIMGIQPVTIKFSDTCNIIFRPRVFHSKNCITVKCSYVIHLSCDGVTTLVWSSVVEINFSVYLSYHWYVLYWIPLGPYHWISHQWIWSLQHSKIQIYGVWFPNTCFSPWVQWWFLLLFTWWIIMW